MKDGDKKIPFIIDNRWIATYCAFLLVYFNCHLNVEVVGFIAAVQYLFKYIYKGHDQAIIEFEKDKKLVYDEEASYLEGRYVIFLIFRINYFLF